MATDKTASTEKNQSNDPKGRPSGHKGLNRMQAKIVLKERAKLVNGYDAERVLNASKQIQKKFEIDGPLGGFLEDIRLLLAVVKDVTIGRYRKIPYGSMASIVAALVYVIDPFDIIPDVVPIIGLSDDGAVLSVCLESVEHDLHEYKRWTAENSL
jgi:uncharacterized membrane protein YkvA (DUF1232 family)